MCFSVPSSHLIMMLLLISLNLFFDFWPLSDSLIISLTCMHLNAKQQIIIILLLIRLKLNMPLSMYICCVYLYVNIIHLLCSQKNKERERERVSAEPLLAAAHKLLLAPSIVVFSVQGCVPFRLFSQTSHPSCCYLQLVFAS